MSNTQFFVLEFDGTENGPFNTRFQAEVFCTKHSLISFDTEGRAIKFIDDYGQDTKKVAVVIIER